MIGGLSLSSEQMKGMPLKERFTVSMWCERAEAKFAVKAADIIREKQRALHNDDEWEENAVSQIRAFNHNLEAATGTYCVLKRLYQSEFDDFSVMEPIIEKLADAMADDLLVKFGWKKESEVSAC